MIECSVERNMQRFCSDFQNFMSTIKVQKSDPLQISDFQIVGSGTFVESNY